MDKQYCGELVQEVCDDHMAESPFNDAGTQLQNMPVECLMDIFSTKSLNLMDFCSLAETCKSFLAITRRLIGIDKRAWLNLHDMYVFESPKFFYSTCERNEIERIIRNFGACLTKVSIGFDEYREYRDESSMLNLVKSHCGERLKYLGIGKCEISATLADDLKPIFKRLQTFSLSGVSIEGNSSPFRDLDSLVELHMEDVVNCSSIFENTFPQLEKFSYTNYETTYVSNNQRHTSLETLATFITRHTVMRSLAIYIGCGVCEERDWMTILQAIGNNCTELREFTIYFVDDRDCLPDSLAPLQSLNSLRTVSLHFVTFENFEAFASLTELRTLRLNFCLLPTNDDEITFLAQLTELSMMDCETMDSYEVTHFIRHLVNLVKLKLLGYFDYAEFVLNQTTLRKIVTIYEERPNKLELECRCDSTVRMGFRSRIVELIPRYYSHQLN